MSIAAISCSFFFLVYRTLTQSYRRLTLVFVFYFFWVFKSVSQPLCIYHLRIRCGVRCLWLLGARAGEREVDWARCTLFDLAFRICIQSYYREDSGFTKTRHQRLGGGGAGYDGGRGR